MFQIAFLLAFITLAVLFLLAQQRILQVINLENREMSPSSVWMQLIPVFGLVWQFFVVIRIARSISKEMTARMGESILDNTLVEIKETDDSPTYSIGLAYCILMTVGITINYSTMHSSSPGLLGFLFVLTGMVCWIIYWVRLVKMKNKIVGFSVAIAR